MNQQVKRAAIYARSATTQERGSGFATDAQIRACTQFADEQGYYVVEGQVYKEIGSGATANRVGLLAALAAAQEGKFDVFVIYDFNRLARNSQLLQELIKQFEEAGVKVESVTEDEGLQLMIAAIFEKVEEVQKERIAIRSRASRKHS